jgi:hypothetical protein
MRTYSSTSREVLSARRITHVLKHNDAFGKRLYYYTISMKACRGRLRKVLQSLGAG